MATPLTDSINALTAYANEVTGVSDTTLSDAVYTLAQGYVSGGNPLQYIKSIAFAPCSPPENYVIDFGGASITSPSSMFQSEITNCTHLTLKNATLSGNANRFFYNRNNSVTHLTLNEFSMANCTIFTQAFASVNLETIDGDPLDLSSATTINNIFEGYYTSKLKDVRFVADSINVSITIGNSNDLTDETLVSVANGLSDTVTGQTLTVGGSTSYARCSTLMGTVTDGTFTADDSGSVTLADFITNTKGWTLSS